MNMPKFAICGAGAAVASLLTLGAANAAMSVPVQHGVKAPIERVDCAVGFHIGPLGTCVIGVENPPPPPPPAAVVVDPPPAVVQNPGPPGGCETQTVKKENAQGESVTHSRTNC